MSSQQAKRERQSLIFGEHERWKLEAGTKPVRAIATPFGLNRNAQVLQHCNVTTDRPRIDFQPFSEFGPAELLARLQQFENGQNPGCGEVHNGLPFWYIFFPSLIRADYSRFWRVPPKSQGCLKGKSATAEV